jgi:hypothetical protein
MTGTNMIQLFMRLQQLTGVEFDPQINRHILRSVSDPMHWLQGATIQAITGFSVVEKKLQDQVRYFLLLNCFFISL